MPKTQTAPRPFGPVITEPADRPSILQQALNWLLRRADEVKETDTRPFDGIL